MILIFKVVCYQVFFGKQRNYNKGEKEFAVGVSGIDVLVADFNELLEQYFNR